MLHLSECFGVHKDFSERTFKISQHRYQVKKTIFYKTFFTVSISQIVM